MKLLSHTVRNYVIYSFLLVLIATPLFYLAIQRLFIHELDEELISHKADFNDALPYLTSGEEVRAFHMMNKEFVMLESTSPVTRDSLYTLEIYDSLKNRIVPYRVFETGAVMMNKNYILRIQESLVSKENLALAIVGIQTLLLVALLVGLIFINRRLSKQIWGPFYLILDKLKKYRIHNDASIELPRSSINEFHDLNVAIHQLMERNQIAFQNQREFAENASHELQTPIAICRSKLELFMQDSELTPGQADLVGSLIEATERLTRLNKNLLLLSKIDSHQFGEIDIVDLNEIVTRNIDTTRKQVGDKDLSIDYSLNPNSSFSGNPILAEILIKNLLSNAFKYSPRGSKISIEFKNNVFSIYNSGPPIKQPSKIFERFYRESESSSGSGLGLAIVKKICDTEGYILSYSYVGTTHQFKILFN